MTVLKKSNWASKAIIFGALGFISIIGFQNCSRVVFSDLNRTANMKATANVISDEGICISCTDRLPQGETADGDILIPIAEAPHSLFLCPQGTESSEKEKSIPSGRTQASVSGSAGAGDNLTSVQATSSGSGEVSVYASSSSSNGRTTATVVQNGEVNTANIFQRGGANDASVMQNGEQNKACVVQVGGANHAEVVQSGADNYVGLNQDIAGTSQIVQNGNATRDQSAVECGCRVVDCNTYAAVSDPICQQAEKQSVITK